MREKVPPDWQRSLDRFREKGLTNAQIAEALRLTASRDVRDPWTYCMAILWGMVDSPLEFKSYDA